MIRSVLAVALLVPALTFALVDEDKDKAKEAVKLTADEKTLIELQRKTIVQETRSAFQAAMQGRIIAAVEALSGRSVAAFISNQHVGPDIEVELFMFAPRSNGTDLP